MDNYEHIDPAFIQEAMLRASNAIGKSFQQAILYGNWLTEEELEIEAAKHTDLGKLLYV